MDLEQKTIHLSENDGFLKVLGDCGRRDGTPGPARPRGVAWGTPTRVAGVLIDSAKNFHECPMEINGFRAKTETFERKLSIFENFGRFWAVAAAGTAPPAPHGPGALPEALPRVLPGFYSILRRNFMNFS